MESKKARLIFRHAAPVRIAHWINAICIIFLLMSGLNIFNAHPALYWGPVSTFGKSLLSIDAENSPQGPKGVTTIDGRTFNTTGYLGVSNEAGQPTPRAFPSWITIPSYYDLATARRWHFLFAWLFVLNGLFYAIYAIGSGHLRRDLFPKLSDLKKIGPTLRDHILLRFPKGEEAKRYNVIQMAAYFVVAFVLLPIMILAGWSMSPGVEALAPFLPTAFGGEQSARTIHFVIAWLIVLFAIVHILMVVLSGLWNNLRSMITGWYKIEG